MHLFSSGLLADFTAVSFGDVSRLLTRRDAKAPPTSVMDVFFCKNLSETLLLHFLFCYLHRVAAITS